MSKNTAKKSYTKTTDDQEGKLKRHNEQAKLMVVNQGNDRSDVNSASTLLAKNKMSSVSHTSNTNESTLPLSYQWDSAVREQKLEKEFRSNSDTGRNIYYIDEELRALHTKAHKIKSDLYKPSLSTHKKGNDLDENKNSANLSEKLLTYLKFQNHPSNQQLSLPTSQSPPTFKRKPSIGEKAGLKAYKADVRFPHSTKNNRSKKASRTLHSSQASSTKNSARGKDSKKAQEHFVNFPLRNPVISSPGNSVSVQKILWRKLSDQLDQKNKQDIQALDKHGTITSPSSRNTARTAKNRLSNPTEIHEIKQANKIQNTAPSEIHEIRPSLTHGTEKVSSSEGLLALMGRIDSILVRYEKQEIRLKQKNTELFRILDQKIAERNALKNTKQAKDQK